MVTTVMIEESFYNVLLVTRSVTSITKATKTFPWNLIYILLKLSPIKNKNTRKKQVATCSATMPKFALIPLWKIPGIIGKTRKTDGITNKYLKTAD